MHDRKGSSHARCQGWLEGLKQGHGKSGGERDCKEPALCTMPNNLNEYQSNSERSRCL
jgi:hypothetical protein